MPTTIGNTVTAKTVQLLTGPSGVNLNLEALLLSGATTVAPLGTAQITPENVALELVERATAVHVPGGERLLRENREPTGGEIPNLFGDFPDGD